MRFTREGYGLGDEGPNHDRGLLNGAARKASQWERRRAVRTCAHHAVDAAEFAELLEMLGLSAAEGR
ncbi:MAG TPA: hypothetical protein VGX25_06745 [Actinophytocola sp.]|uniref:hypothetical protein n=1 Tax=Actinophytocola sp. TaxID=1872138 RepID=UPI002DDCCCE6|nr:hypothetical protein [Actinophytocola sp.]HEV2779086.1 hypothetical protein [Actinophytocola sp.]